VGRIGSNSVSTSLRGRRLPAIFPKRCKARGQAGSSGLGLPGAVARRKYYIFFSWMKRNKNHGCASFLTGKSQTADSRLQTRLDAWWVMGAWGIAWCWVFKLVGRIGSNSVSAPLRGRRLPAIFPKRCKAGGQAGASWAWSAGAVAWGRAVPVGWSRAAGRWAFRRRSQSGRTHGGHRLVLNLNLSLNLGGAAPGFSWGRLRLVFGGVSARLRLRAWLRLLGSTVCGLMPGSEGWSSGLGLPGRWLGISSVAGRWGLCASITFSFPG
jgi:hypothetical protein